MVTKIKPLLLSLYIVTAIFIFTLVSCGQVDDPGAATESGSISEGSITNTTPTISNINSQSINEDFDTGALNFTISDAETAAASFSWLAKPGAKREALPRQNRGKPQHCRETWQ